MSKWSERYPPHVLREYSLIADGERGAVVGPRGEIAWMCFPGWADEAVFGDLVGGPGLFAVTPIGDRFVWGGYYEEGSLIWRSRWVTTDAVLECREALARPARPDRAVLLRRICGREGQGKVQVVLDPAGGYHGPGVSQLRRSDDGSWELRAGDRHLRVRGMPDATERDGALVAEFEMAAGQQHELVVELASAPFDEPPPGPDQLWSVTERTWRADVPPPDGVVAARDVRHAQAVLRGLTSERGGMVAAATTSLPERADAGRNYDYRYVWVRDLAMAGQAVARLGPADRLESAMHFITARILEDGPDLHPAYHVGGGMIPEQDTIDLPGYPGGVDHVGNPVAHQFQLDVFGESLLLLAAAGRQGMLSTDGWRAVRTAADALEKRYQEEDRGIWEIEPAHWAHSRLIGAAGLRGVAGLAPTGGAGRVSALADALVADADRDCLHATGRWQRARGDERVDSALLIPSIRGAVPIGEPRSVATIEEVLADLGEDLFLYRFRHGAQPLSQSEGAFLLSGFHASIAQSMLGREVEEARCFERNRSACGPSGLFTEEFDVGQRQLRGNLPQAFVHAALIEAAAQLTG